MAYIGRGLDKISNVEKLDNLTFDGSSTSYSLLKGGVSFTPSSANNILISIDGVVQAGNFTCSGSTIDFGTAVSGSSTCDFILHYGVGVITTPSDGSVTTAKLADSSVSLAKLTATGTKDSTTFLRGDNTFASAGGTNTPYFQAYASSNQNMTPSTFTKVNFAGETFDTNSNYDTATSRFTPTIAGKYFIASQITTTYSGTGPANEYMEIRKNGSNIKRGNIRGANHGYGFNYVAEIVEFNGSSDYVEIFAFGDPTTTYIMEGNASGQESTFYGYKIIE